MSSERTAATQRREVTTEPFRYTTTGEPANGLPGEDGAAWGANLPNSPIMGVSYWSGSTDTYPQLKAFPPIYVYLVPVNKWSDGTDGPSMNSARE